MLLALFILALLGVTWLGAKAPPTVRAAGLAVVTVGVLLLATTSPSSTVLVGSAVVLAAAVGTAATTCDWRYQLSKLVPMRFGYTLTDTGPLGPEPSVAPYRATWWQWRDHVMRHREHALPG